MFICQYLNYILFELSRRYSFLSNHFDYLEFHRLLSLANIEPYTNKLCERFIKAEKWIQHF